MLLRIFITGLVAFVPSADESEITVLLSDTQNLHGHVERHEPIVLVRADQCSGACRPPAEHELVTGFLFPDEDGPTGRARYALDDVIADGGFWNLSGSDLDIQTGVSDTADEPLRIVRGASSTDGESLQLPRSEKDLSSFDWVPAMGSILDGAGAINPDALSDHPQEELIIARATLRAGQIRTYTVAQLDETVLPVQFALGLETASEHPVRAMAEWVVAEIPIEDCRFTLIDRGFEDQRQRRSMTVSLDSEACRRGETLDMVIMNLPASSFHRPKMPREPLTADAMVGRHFDHFYELSASVPSGAQRLLPTPVLDVEGGLRLSVNKKIGAAGKVADASTLLDKLLPPPRGFHSRPICPPVQFAPPADISPAPSSIASSP